MESETTLELLYREIDNSMLQNEKSYSNEIMKDLNEKEDNDYPTTRGSNLSDDEANTEINSNGSPFLSSPFKIQHIEDSQLHIQNDFEKPNIKNINIESLSGGTYINHSQTQTKQMSPNSVKLINILTEQNSESDSKSETCKSKGTEDDTERLDSTVLAKMRKHASLPKSFSLGSTIPLLSPEMDQNNSYGSPVQLSLMNIYKNNDIESSPQILHSPSKIPITDNMTFQQYLINSSINKPVVQIESDKEEDRVYQQSNIDIPTTRYSSGSSYNADKLELSITHMNDKFNLLTNSVNDKDEEENESSHKDPEQMPNEVVPNFGKLYKNRMISIATSIGDYHSAKENQTESQLAPETEEYITELSISTGDNFYEEATSNSSYSEYNSSQTLDSTKNKKSEELSFNENENSKDKILEEKELPLDTIISKDGNINQENDTIYTNNDSSFTGKIQSNDILTENIEKNIVEESFGSLNIDIENVDQSSSINECCSDLTSENSGSDDMEEGDDEIKKEGKDKESLPISRLDAHINHVIEDPSEYKKLHNNELVNNEKQFNIRIPSIPTEPTLESKFIDDIFNTEEEPSYTYERDVLIKPNNYLAIWHLQEKRNPALDLKVKDDSLTAHVNKNNRKQSLKVENINYSFKPKLIHNPKINYLEKNKTESDITISLSQEFENALKNLTSEPPSRSVSIIHRPVKIWPEFTDNTNMEKLQHSKEVSIAEVFGEKLSSEALKTPGKLASIDIAESIKSFHVGEESDSKKLSPVTPIKDSSYTNEIFNKGTGHVSSPFKVVSKNGKTQTPATIEKSNEEVMILQQSPNDLVNTPTETANHHQIKNENIFKIDPQIGCLFIKLESISIPLTGIKQHDAQFSLEIDNGINVTRTEWKPSSDDKCLILDNQLYIPILKEKPEKLYLTLKCKYRRPQTQLVEVVEKVRVGKSFGGFGKNKYIYERRFAERKVENDEWDYLFAQDGSFARAEIVIDNDFLEKHQNYRHQSDTEDMLNQWAKVIPNNASKKKIMLKELPRREPFVAASLKYNAYYTKKTDQFEQFPKTLKDAVAMAEKFKKQQEMKKEGYLVQDGGDLNGLIEKRYFKLHGTNLTGYNERTMKPKIAINLLNVKEIISTMDEENFNGKSNRNFTNLFLFGECFTLIFKNDETISFNCQLSGEETRDWYLCLKEVIEMNVTHQPWIKRLAEEL